MSEYQPVMSGGATVYVHKSLEELPSVDIDVDDSYLGTKLMLRGLAKEQKNCC